MRATSATGSGSRAEPEEDARIQQSDIVVEGAAGLEFGAAAAQGQMVPHGDLTVREIDDDGLAPSPVQEVLVGSPSEEQFC